ncbi:MULTISPECIES: MBL fold metallo-hydrolase [Eubacterium]|uniref:Phosphoribosyl 1,2-cyclic phosphodiesterase n=1 Tax=Eubacterium barkeri TaxID=1528 RepID=A0A1H3F5X9_EUBBA|nr:MBL fold metallo-hydrolase [Eubacterium barkeri]SDX86310.1 Phosphoribosyl 1,2-cyclic phosphodiesterase [Eubacterium barkeri]
MKFCSLYSGSSGNSLFVAQGATRLLIDAGLSGKKIEQAMMEIDELPATLSGILVTHEHRDHIHGVGVLSRRYGLPVYANAQTWQGMAGDLGKMKDSNICLFATDVPFSIGDVQITAFPTSHDAAESVGFILDGGHGTMAVATDTGCTTAAMVESLRGHHLVVLESNHDPAMLETGPYPFPLKQRIRGDHGHLSNAAAGETVCELVDSGVPHIVLAHLSQENNYPVLAYQATELALTACGKVPGKDLTLEVAGRSQRSEIYEW